MANFDIWWQFCMDPDRDGNAEDTADDGAGLTRWGWTYPTWVEAKSFIQGVASLDGFKAMNRDQAGVLAQIYYWNRLGGHLLRSGADVVVLDWAWTSGGAIREIQKRVGVKVDGDIGPITAKAIDAFPDFIAACSDWRKAYYDALNFRERFPGLYARTDACAALASKLERLA